MAIDTRKTLKRGKNDKREISEKFNKVTTTIKLFAFIFYLLKRIYFAQKYSLVKCSLYYCISNKVLFSVARYLKRSNKTTTFMQICAGLANVVLWPEILGNRVGILTSVLIAMDYFFRRQKSTFNLENNIKQIFFVYHVTGSTYSRIIFLAMRISRIYTILWKELEKLN